MYHSTPKKLIHPIELVKKVCCEESVLKINKNYVYRNDSGIRR